MMIPRRASTASGPAVRHLWPALIAIIAGFIISTAISIYETRNAQTQVLSITAYRLLNIELVSRLLRDLNKERLLLDAYLLERRPARLDRIEAELATVQTDTLAAMLTYKPSNAAVRNIQQQLHSELLRLQPSFGNVISLAHSNRPVQARAAMETIQPQFEQINRTADDLLHLNQKEADEGIARTNVLQQRAVIVLGILTAAWTAIALVTATWVTRLIAERENQMEERNRELDAFAGRVAHDLRGPLNTINLAASAIVKPEIETSKATGALRRGVASMERIISDLLSLSRISAQINGATCQMASVAALLREDLTPQVEAVGGLLRVEAVDATVTCREGLLRQALMNIGENAVKYRRPEVQLQATVFGRITPDGYEITVTDNGMGMSPNEIRQAFEPFFRGERARGALGSGLGLSIVKRVIEASGGSVSIDSVPGRGTTFRIHLPTAAAKAA